MNFTYLSILAVAALWSPVRSLTKTMAVTSAGNRREIELVNESGQKLVVDWIHPDTGERVPIAKDFNNGAKTVFDTFVNHTFAIHESSSSPSCGVLDGAEDCGIQYIIVSENNEQVAVVKKGLVVAYEDTAIRGREEAHSITEECRQTAKEALVEGCNSEEVMNELVECLEDTAISLVQEKNEEVAFESKIRLDISASMENHTCSEPSRETTKPQEIRIWLHQDTPGEQVQRTVHVLHNRPSSQIHALKNFISPEECDAIQKAAKPKLHRGTVANGSGGSKLSDHRKAWQAAIKVRWEKEKDGDLIARVVRRIYDYTNNAVGYNLSVDGQEDIMSIQYFGMGKNATESPDQYRPHCDGDCDGLLHKSGGRVATMVMYCDAPELGGGTNFQNSNVFVKPEVGAAAFFSYLNIETMEKDNGFSTHSGCPVIEGTKRIAVHWMRQGVDKETPWDSFNTLTVKIEDEDENC